MEMGEKIDLGIKDEMPEDVLMPATQSEAKADRVAKTRYPHFHVDGEDELEIPKKGKAMIEYEIVWEQEEKREDGSEHYSCKVQIKSIQPCEGEDEDEEEDEPKAPAKSGTDAEDALDKLMAAVMAAKKD